MKSDDLPAWLLAQGVQLSPWQRQLLDQMATKPDPPWRLQLNIGRRSGRATADRFAVVAAVALGVHIHVAARDGLWCVNRTDVGPLWERVATPGKEPR